MGGNQNIVDRIKSIKDILIRQGASSQQLNTPMDVLEEVLRRFQEADEDNIDLATVTLADGRSVTSQVERRMIAKSLSEHNGDYKAAMVSLQRNITKSDIDAGYTPKAAAQRARRHYPAIFA